MSAAVDARADSRLEPTAGLRRWRLIRRVVDMERPVNSWWFS
jgi:hypothetical protein